MTVQYVIAAFLTAANCGQACIVLAPGQRYESQSPNQNPNWCVINRGKAAAPVRFEIVGAKMLLGRGVEPCSTPTS